jgi:hypothetical protein
VAVITDKRRFVGSFWTQHPPAFHNPKNKSTIQILNLPQNQNHNPKYKTGCMYHSLGRLLCSAHELANQIRPTRHN